MEASNLPLASVLDQCEFDSCLSFLKRDFAYALPVERPIILPTHARFVALAETRAPKNLLKQLAKVLTIRLRPEQDQR